MTALLVWIIINILPEPLAMWLLDLIWPGWVDAARKAKSMRK